MLQQALERLTGLPCNCPIVVCNEEHRFLVGEQSLEMEVKDFSIILEPAPRNTAPAKAIAAIHALANDENALLLILPADHVIADAKGLLQSCNGYSSHRQGRQVHHLWHSA